MFGVRVTIVRYISDEPQPGIVECKLEDAPVESYILPLYACPVWHRKDLPNSHGTSCSLST
jgi:hypothetical protein